MPVREMRARTAKLHALVFVGLSIGGTVPVASLSRAQPATPPTPAAAQPSVPQPLPETAKSEAPPVVRGLIGEKRPHLEVRKHITRVAVRRHHVHHRPPPLERPTLAGVALVAPLPIPPEPPHFYVPVPAYPFESIAAAFTTPPPPLVCRHAAREPGVPDPRLYRERTVACGPDNP